MIYIISGEDIVSSRKKLTELLEGKPNVVRLNGKESSIAEVEMALASSSLFGEQKTVVIEYFSKLKSQEKLMELCSKFAKDKSIDIILWDEVELDKKKFDYGKAYSFSFPKFYYQFLDSFEPGSKRTLELLRDVLKTFEPEQVLYGLIRRLRQLLVIKSGGIESFSEFKRMQSWQISKLKKQASLWTEDQLKKVFLDLAELDEKMKTSNLPMPLRHQLDILLLSALN